jgi:hypothetical protein
VAQRVPKGWQTLDRPKPLGDIVSRAVSDCGVDELVAARPGEVGIVKPSRFQLLT